MGKKRFTKNPQDVRHFKLVSRSQHDPNAGDRDATPLVLEAFIKPNEPRRTGLAPEQLLDIPESLHGIGAKVFGRGERKEEESEDEDGDVEAELEELDADCYFPKDGYNYEKHLRGISNAGKEKIEKDAIVMLVEPDADKASAAANEVDTLALGKAKAKELAPELPGGFRRNLEEDEALAALDDADEYEDINDDEFAGLLGSGTAVEPELVIWGRLAEDGMPDLEAFKAAHKARLALGSDGDMPELDDDAAMQQMMAAAKAGAARAGESVDPKEFEELMDNEYGDDELGDLEEHDLQEEAIGEDELDGILDEYFEDKKNEQKYLKSMNDPRAGMSDSAPRMIEQTKAIIARYEALGEDQDTDSGGEDTTQDGSRDVDCESVLSTLSNISNRPGRIGRIKIVKKPVATPVASIKEGKEEEEEEESEEEEIIDLPDVITERKKDETPEEKKARKQSVKQMRKVCREMKKESKQVYKGEAAKLNRPGNNDVRSGLRTQKL